jgi:hypothetical protein
MIFVTRKEGESSTKVVGNFLKRVKKSNMMQRARKTQNHTKKRTARIAKEKALKTVKWLKANEFNNLAKF